MKANESTYQAVEFSTLAGVTVRTEQGQRDWVMLISEAETAVAEGVDPKSERAATLATRWDALIKGFTGGNKEIQAGLNKMYPDLRNCRRIFPNLTARRLEPSCVKRWFALQKE